MLALSWLREAAEADALRLTMIGTLGLEAIAVTEDSVVVRMPYAIALTSIGGAVHSGALVGLAETAAYLAVLNHDAYHGASLPALVTSKQTFLAPTSGDVVATAHVIGWDASTFRVEVVLRSHVTPVALVHSEFRLARSREDAA